MWAAAMGYWIAMLVAAMGLLIQTSELWEAWRSTNSARPRPWVGLAILWASMIMVLMLRWQVVGAAIDVYVNNATRNALVDRIKRGSKDAELACGSETVIWEATDTASYAILFIRKRDAWQDLGVGLVYMDNARAADRLGIGAKWYYRCQLDSKWWYVAGKMRL